MHKIVALFVILSSSLLAQQSPTQGPELKKRTDLPGQQASVVQEQKPFWIIPAGTKIPVQLRQAISTKNAQPGDSIYGQTVFPVVVGDQVMIPGGTYVQGVVDHVKRAGRVKGTAELKFHLTTILYPNGYTLNVAAAVEQVPGDENSRMKEPGTMKHDSEKGKDLERVGRNSAEAGAVGGMIGAAASGTGRGFGIGGVSGAAAGALLGVLARGSDLRFEMGTVVDVVLNHAIALDPDKLMRVANVPAYYPSQQQEILRVPRQTSR